jgi:hypothetical protein
MTINRIDPSTLELTLNKGLFPTAFSRYQRDSNERFSVGDAVQLAGMTVTVASLNPLGDPQRIRYTF